MTRRGQLIAVLCLAAGLLVIFLMWRAPQETEITSPTPSSPLAPTSSAKARFPSPVRAPTVTPGSSPLLAPTTATYDYSPLPLPPTAAAPITTATLAAIRSTRPTASPPSPSGTRAPYISPATWRVWALRILAAAGVMAIIGLRLSRTQKT